MRGAALVRPLLALVLLGCSTASEVCTLIGCESGVRLHLSALPSQPFRVEVGVPGSNVTYVFDCTTDAGQCRQDIFFPSLIVTRLLVTVRVGGLSRQTEIAPLVYAHSRPNGPNCPPDCQTADVSAPIP
jgi:hypothetical protein